MIRRATAILFIVCSLGVAHAGPVNTKQASVESLARSVTVTTANASSAVIKGQPSQTQRIKLVRTPGEAKPQKLAYQGLTRQKMHLRSGSAKTSTRIRIGYPQCAESDTQCSASTRSR